MVAVAFMRTESSYLIRGAMGKSLLESPSLEWLVHHRGKGKKKKTYIFLQDVDPYHGCRNLTEWLVDGSVLFSQGAWVVCWFSVRETDDDLR